MPAAVVDSVAALLWINGQVLSQAVHEAEMVVGLSMRQGLRATTAQLELAKQTNTQDNTALKEKKQQKRHLSLCKHKSSLALQPMLL